MFQAPSSVVNKHQHRPQKKLRRENVSNGKIFGHCFLRRRLGWERVEEHFPSREIETRKELWRYDVVPRSSFSGFFSYRETPRSTAHDFHPIERKTDQVVIIFGRLLLHSSDLHVKHFFSSYDRWSASIEPLEEDIDLNSFLERGRWRSCSSF